MVSGSHISCCDYLRQSYYKGTKVTLASVTQSESDERKTVPGSEGMCLTSASCLWWAFNELTNRSRK